ncbi:MAG: hypothetical protein JW837_09165 [Sedimentisphaerales bacterium]|nr:hypothetical protein [Sedimentisphaerales bacterium]
MFDFFEQPYTLIGAAVIVLFGVFTYRSVVPEKRRWRQFLFPIFVAAVGIALDMLVQTDPEKINSAIKTVVKAVQEEDCDTLEAMVAEDYRDSYHKSKSELTAHCRRRLTSALVEKNTKTASLVELSSPNATATIFMTTIFDKNSFVSQNYKSFIFLKIELRFQKQSDRTWLINRCELLEIDKQPAKWNDIN